MPHPPSPSLPMARFRPFPSFPPIQSCPRCIRLTSRLAPRYSERRASRARSVARCQRRRVCVTTDQLFIAALAGAVLLLLGLLIGILAGRRARPVTAPSTKPDLVPLAPAGATTLPALPGPDTLQPMVADLRDRLAGLQDDVRALQTATAAGEARRGPEDQAWQSIQRVERALASLSPLPHQQQS